MIHLSISLVRTYYGHQGRHNRKVSWVLPRGPWLSPVLRPGHAPAGPARRWVLVHAQCELESEPGCHFLLSLSLTTSVCVRILLQFGFAMGLPLISPSHYRFQKQFCLSKSSCLFRIGYWLLLTVSICGRASHSTAACPVTLPRTAQPASRGSDACEGASVCSVAHVLLCHSC